MDFVRKSFFLNVSLVLLAYLPICPSRLAGRASNLALRANGVPPSTLALRGHIALRRHFFLVFGNVALVLLTGPTYKSVTLGLAGF